jgi:hypothetical protein
MTILEIARALRTSVSYHDEKITFTRDECTVVPELEIFPNLISISQAGVSLYILLISC